MGSSLAQLSSAPSKSALERICALAFETRHQLVPQPNADQAIAALLGIDATSGERAHSIRTELAALITDALRENKPPAAPAGVDERLVALLARIVEHHREEWSAECAAAAVSPAPPLLGASAQAFSAAQLGDGEPTDASVVLGLTLGGGATSAAGARRFVEMSPPQLAGLLESLGTVKKALDHV